MGVITPGSILQVKAILVYDNASRIENVYHVQHDGTQDISDDDFMEAAALWLDDAYTELVNAMATAVAFVKVDGYDMSADAPMVEAAWPTLTAGTGLGEALPLQNACLVSFPTSVKQTQGRKYLGGFTEDITEAGGVLLTAQVTRLEDYADIILPGFQVDIEDMTPGTYNHTLVKFSQFVTWRVNAVMRTQRRRVLGVGV